MRITNLIVHLLYSVVALLLGSGVLVADDWRVHDNPQLSFEEDPSQLEPTPTPYKVSTRRRFKGFGSYRSRFKKICRSFERDNQSGWLAFTALRYKTKIKDCVPCRNIYLVISSACREHSGYRRIIPTPTAEEIAQQEADAEMTPEVEVEGTPTPSPTPTFTPTPGAPQELEPRLDALDLISTIAREMAEDSDFSEENFQGIMHLVAEMRKTEGKSVAERWYYDIVAAFFIAPFEARGFLKGPIAVPGSTEVPSPKPTPNVRDLFEF